MKTNAVDNINDRQEQVVANVAGTEPGEAAHPAAVASCHAVQRKQYREHQIRAINSAVRHYQHNDRGQLICPCGCGKTSIAQGIRESLGARSTIVLVPSLLLVSQFKKEWASWATKPYDTMCVGSDVRPDTDEDAVRISPSELEGPVSTVPCEIAQFLRRPDPKVVFSTYQSLKAVCGAAKEASVVFDLAVCDEAHRTAGHDLNLFGEIHHDDSIAVRKRLYMTATPRVSRPLNGASPSGSDHLRNMDNPRTYGHPFFQMTFKEAIDGALLADYRIMAIGITDQVIAESAHMRKQSRVIASVEDVAMNYALDLMMRKHGVRKVITFHRRVKDAADFAERHRRLFADIVVSHVNGEMKPDDRKSHLERFANAERSVVTNAQCLREGVDVPAIDAVMFCDPKQSTIDIVQAAGRALRTDKSRPGKLANIIVPVFHRRKDLLDAAVSEREFRQVVNVVRAMSDEDEVLKGAVTEAAWKATSASDQKCDAKSCKLELVGFDHSYPEQLFAQVVAKAANGWDVQFEHLGEFRRQHPGRWPPHMSQFPEGNGLGKWCQHQREARRRNGLSSDRIERLDKIGFPWGFEDAWMQQYRHLQGYRLVHPGQWPTIGTQFPPGNRLGSWHYVQREKRRNGELHHNRVELLDKLGFPWRNPDTWTLNYERLQKFRADNPHRWPVATKKLPKDKLGTWCATQRTNRRKGKLTNDRIERLDCIGFPWEKPDEWTPNYRSLQKFREDNPDRWPSMGKDFPQEMQLGAWCVCQRGLRKRSRLSSDHIERLDRIGFPWKRADEWMKKYQCLREYRLAHPDRWPAGHEEFPRGNKIGQWCGWLRDKHRKLELSKDRIERLDQIGFPWGRRRHE